MMSQSDELHFRIFFSIFICGNDGEITVVVIDFGNSRDAQGVGISSDAKKLGSLWKSQNCLSG